MNLGERLMGRTDPSDLSFRSRDAISCIRCRSKRFANV